MHNMPNTGWEQVPNMVSIRQIRLLPNLQRAADERQLSSSESSARDVF